MRKSQVTSYKLQRNKGMTLFMAVTIMGILLFISFAIVNISIKSNVFATSGRDSQFAFYAADAGVECALYWDAAFEPSKFDTATGGSPISCAGTSISTNDAIAGTTTLATIGGVGSGSVGNSASYVALDTSTRGNWHGVYGTRGYSVAGGTENEPSGTNISFINSSFYMWDGNPSDSRAPYRDSVVTSRVAATWYSQNSFDIDVNITNGSTYHVGLYALDWDTSNSRTERIDVLDGDTLAVLSTQNISSFTNGKYLIWNVSGHVIFRVTNTNGAANAVVSAVMIDQGSASGGESGSSTFGFTMNQGVNPVPYCAIVSVTKNANGTTYIKSRGYNTCDMNDPRRIERGVEVLY